MSMHVPTRAPAIGPQGMTNRRSRRVAATRQHARRSRHRRLCFETMEDRRVLSRFQFAVATSTNQVAVFSVGTSISVETRSVSPTSDLAIFTNGTVRGASYRIDQTAAGGYQTYSNYPAIVSFYDSSGAYVGGASDRHRFPLTRPTAATRVERNEFRSTRCAHGARILQPKTLRDVLDCAKKSRPLARQWMSTAGR